MAIPSRDTVNTILSLVLSALAIVGLFYAGFTLEYAWIIAVLLLFYLIFRFLPWAHEAWRAQEDPTSERYRKIVLGVHNFVGICLVATVLLVMGAGASAVHLPGWFEQQVQDRMRSETPNSSPHFHAVAIPIEWEKPTMFAPSEGVVPLAVIVDREKKHVRIENLRVALKEAISDVSESVRDFGAASVLFFMFAVLFLFISELVGERTHRFTSS